MNAEKELRVQIDRMRFLGTDLQHIEVKSGKGGFPKNISETISAFANNGGGRIILGIDEKADFSPVAINAKKYADQLTEVCEKDFNLVLHPEIDIVSFEKHMLVVMDVPEISPKDKPCYIKKRGGVYGNAYIRTSDGDHRLTGFEIDRMRENHEKPRWDIEPVQEARLEDLDKNLVRGILMRERQMHPRIFGDDDISDLRKLRVLAPIDPSNTVDVPIPTLAGLLALGQYPQYFFPQLTVTCTAYPGVDKGFSENGERFLDNVILAGPIPMLVENAVAFVAKNMRTASYVTGAVRINVPDYPLESVREAITNALMHRDYSPEARGAQVQVNLFVDRLEVLNPGGLFGTVTIDQLGKDGVSDSRNQFLAKILESTPYQQKYFVAENRGSGYADILSQLRKMHRPAPVPENNLRYFRLTFPIRGLNDENIISSQNDDVVQQLSEMKRRRNGEGKRNEERVVEILAQTSSATSHELATQLGVSIGGVRRILKSMVEAGVIERTEPARSPRQRYRLPSQ